jgi:hypothetical protein
VTQLRTIVGFTAMLVFAVCAIEWIAMVLVPTMLGSGVTADLGTLTFWTLLTLALWRAGAGKGWGFSAGRR